MAKVLRKTLQLPKTSFPMRANAATREQNYTQKTTTQLYRWMQEQRSQQGAELFQLHDGPPYANGGLHTGHLLNKVLKDITNRFQVLQGKRVRYIPGWDCHGLPIELKALEEGKLDRRTADALTIRSTARECAEGVVKVHRDSFIRWGIMADWDEGELGDVYLTMDPSYESKQLQVLSTMMEKGYVKRGLKPVYWSPSSMTALAEAELEYNAEHKSTAIYCSFRLQLAQSHDVNAEQRALLEAFPDLEAVIWTTTPWTIPSNMAVCANSNLDYVVVEYSGRHFLMTEKASEEIFQSEASPYKVVVGANGSTDVGAKVVHHVKGSAIVGLNARHPLRRDGMDHAVVPVFHGDHVTSEAGSGLVHTSPSHGVEDFDIYTEHRPDGAIFDIITDDGYFVQPSDNDAPDASGPAASHSDRVVHNIEHAVAPEHADRLAGLELFSQGNTTVLELLASEGSLLARDDNFIHSYPYDWRSKQPVMLRTTEQWFASLTNEDGHEALQQTALDNVQNSVNVVPEAGVKRLSAMLFGRSEWCISRQRVWGVPIPAFVRKASGGGSDRDEVIMTPESILHFAKIVEQDPLGTNCWWTLPVDELLPPVGSPARDAFPGSAAEYEKCTDTLDVWFDSGSSWNVVLGDGSENGGEFRPADLYLEGSDQHRGWFLSSLLTATACTGSAPYKTVLTHGFCVDEEGKKMSKSIGNVVDPNELVHGVSTPSDTKPQQKGKKGKQKGKKGKKNAAAEAAAAGYGADVCRIWAASSNFTTDVSIGATSVQKASEAVRKIRNVTRFLLGNLYDFDPIHDHVAFPELRPLEQYMLHKLATFNDEMSASYSSYNYNKGFRALMTFISTDLSSFYMEATKDCLYADAADGYKRRCAQTVYLHLLCGIMSSMSPVLCFTAEDIHEHFPPQLQDWFRDHQQVVSAEPSSDEQLFSIFQYGWYNSSKHADEWLSAESEANYQNWERARQLRSSVLTLLEQARSAGHIRSPAEAQVYLLSPQNSTASPKAAELWTELKSSLRPSSEALMASQVTFLECPQTLKQRVSMARHSGGTDSWCIEASVDHQSGDIISGNAVDDVVTDGENAIQIALAAADGAKCQRCWKFCPSAARSTEPVLCFACADVVATFDLTAE